MSVSRTYGSKKAMDPARALARLEELCARAEHCEGELREKLHKWGIPSAQADKIIASLRSRRFVDDSRFASAFVRDKFRFALWGKRKIEMALRQKRVDADVIADALEEIDPEEYRTTLAALVTRKAASLPEDDFYANRTRLFRFAVARGFEPSLVAESLPARK